jgi:membrane fusion protein, multidrug efflux system
MSNVQDPKAPELETSGGNGQPAPRSRARFAVLLLLVVAAGAGAWYYFSHLGQVSSDDAQVDGHITSIAPKISGNIAEVLVSDNQVVKAGDPLVRIDARDYEARVAQAKAALAQAESQLTAARSVVPLTNESTEAGTSSATAGLADADAEYERAKAAYDTVSSSDLAVAEANVRARAASNDRAQADLARMKPLADKAEISKLQYDAYVASARVAQSELEAAQHRLTSARGDINVRKAQLNAAQSKINQAKAQVASSLANRKQVAVRTADAGTAAAAVEAARANLAAAELQLSYTTITAPVDGSVTHKSVERGQVVSPGQGLMAIIPLDKSWITANFKETQLAKVHAGQRAEVSVDMYGTKIPAKVDSIAAATGSRMSLLPPENATGNFVKVVQRIPVKLVVDGNHALTLRPGMNVDVTIYTD